MRESSVELSDPQASKIWSLLWLTPRQQLQAAEGLNSSQKIDQLPSHSRTHSQMSSRQTDNILSRMAMLMSKGDDEIKRTLIELLGTLVSYYGYNTTNIQAMLNNKAVMDVLLNLSATTSSADVAEKALWVLLQLAYGGDNAKRRLFQEHPSLVPVAMRKLEFGAENATEDVQLRALEVLRNLASDVDNTREMATNNPTLVLLLVAKMESGSEKV
ncbi:hypothetical protein BASA81_004766 [Batrachochytrium salamandrivorans]|nr:hypothetical protein BASA81_004766 [Batrachochytrium salamandrivorans]